MSVRTLSKVWDGFPGGGSELLALLALADWSDDEGCCFPSMASIGRKIRLSEKQARRVVHSLEEAGFLRVTGGQTGGGMSRRYQIALDRLTPPAGGRAPTDGRVPAGVPNPSRPREGTPPTHGRRTVSEPSKNRQEDGDKPTVTGKAVSADTGKKSSAAKGSRLPADWQLPKAWGEWALQEAPTWAPEQVRKVAERFRDYWIAKPGREGFKADWLATWRNWVRREAERTSAAPARSQPVGAPDPFRGAL